MIHLSNTFYGFLLTILAGAATMIGTILIFIKFKNQDRIIQFSLSFAAGVMITVSFTDLIPESFSMLSKVFYMFPAILFCAIFFAVGILFSMLIDKFLPTDFSQNSSLYRIGIFSMLAIILHNIPEGIATFMATHDNLTLGLSLATAIALHNIPEGISISIPIYYGTKSRGKSIFYTFVSAISEPFGALLAFLFLSPFINDFVLGILFSMIAGIMVHIASYELIPAGFQYDDKFRSIVAFLIGAILMILNHFCF